MLIINILAFLLGVLVGLIIMALLSVSSRERDRIESCKMSKAIRDYESKTIDVTEVIKSDSING